ncbi:TPA: LPXTG cell wall anchor domain-containing protein [Streptococcus agalactiae]|uniref:SspB-related isopeptide-forming adhesin n=4 Tax=Streptococcus agalactiae TaxID=1311 RepID=UPI000F5CF8C7|nr:SspB-related isopeptide-forming adhesin [Streptococcus agalactiae]RRA57516.1 LPXTG cell wall anchor domain-containing protein [Streptococcus agalactiae]HEN6747005.1 LPXTG cell wall anchor domain-containing protein [Streptococcus agalactiae]HEN7481589.1 LPXTG cell wall anchor domain-containing protein [Streptococcus agalactiae]HEO2521301.1 LPXTG cell wall anchor domain-containing protein [Streptococcus agalactiae]HEO2573489.1 LPXTG cell wall anchor domain-containing protein [Streptococcus ag
MNSQETKGHGFFRKTKAYGLVCGIALALAAAFTLATSQVSADQVTTQATTQTVTQNQTNTVTSTQLDKAVDTAKKAAVAVTTTPAVNHATTTDAQADLANQTQAVKDVTAKAQANTQAIKDATAENAKIDAENKAESQRVAKANKAGQAEVDARNKAGQAEVDARNKAKQQAQDDQKAKIDAENKAESQRVSQLNAQTKAKIDAENKDAQAKADATNAQLQKDYQAKLAEIKSVEAYNAGVRQRNKDAQAKADATNAQLQKDYQAKLALYNQAKKAKEEADKQTINNVAFDIKAQARGVDNKEYGNSIMTAKTKPDGSFEFNHDMIDGVKTIGYGKLTGKVNHHYVANKDGSVTAFVDSVTLYKYEYRNVAQNAAVNQNIVFRVLTKDGRPIFEKAHNGNKTFAETLNKTLQLNLKYELKPHASSGNVEVFKLHDDWVHDTHGSALVSYVNNNDAVPNVVIPERPTPPSPEKVTPEAEKPVPEKPVEPKLVTPTLKTYTPVKFIPKEYKPEPITPEKFTPEKFNPILPKIKPHTAVPEKVHYTVTVHPVQVPKANPTKAVVDENGQSIDGKSVLPNTTLNYVAKQNFSQYKGIKASAEAIAKGFAFVDQPNEALAELTVKSIKASNGDDVSSLLEMRHVLSKDTLDQKLQSLIKEAGISPVGEFYMWTAKDPQAFYKAYVQKGLDITYNLSFKIKANFTKGQIKNGVAQIDFGNGYTGNIVVNDVTVPEVHKDILDKEDGKSINNSTVKLGDEVTYKLEGWVVPANRGYDLFEYKFVDQLQHTHDLYLRDKVVAKVDVTLKDGTVIKKGTNLGEYTETVYNKTTGRYELAFKKEFLAKVSRESEFGADDFIVVKRIKAGDVYNTADLYVNGYKVKSETVVTHTTEKPKPVEPQKATPKAPAKGLPQTGEQGVSVLTVLGAGLLSLLGLVGLKKRQQ